MSKRTRRASSLMRATFAVPNVPARRKISEVPNKCACKGNCSSKLCSCQKKGDKCGEHCKCSDKCINKRLHEEGENEGEAGFPTNFVQTEHHILKKHSLDVDGLDLDGTYDVTPKKLK